MLKSSIKDPSIAIRPSDKLFEFIESLSDTSIDLPENLLNVYRVYTKDIQKRNVCKPSNPTIDYTENEKDLLNTIQTKVTGSVEIASSLRSLSLNIDTDDDSSSDVETLSTHESDTTKPVSKNKARLNRAKQREKEIAKLQLNLSDLIWLNQYLATARKTDESIGYLHQLIEGSQLILPKNVMVERNPELEARCQRLKREQEEYTYRAMTKNVDCSRTHVPEDTISYQLKQINRQLIAVLQFIFSVIAGFAFGFIGVELIIGNLDFGFRLLLGIICSLIIALAEIYFLAKKLNEDVEMADQPPFIQPQNNLQRPVNNKKAHAD